MISPAVDTSDAVRRARPGPRRRPTAVTLLLWTATAVGAVVAAVVLAPGSVARATAPVALVLVSLASAAVTAAAAVRSRTLRPVWAVVTVVLLLWTTASVGYVITPIVQLGPAWIDGVYAVAYALQLVLPVVFLRSLRLRPHTTVALDGLVAGLGALALTMALVLGPAFRATDTSLLALAYVVADLALLALLVGLVSVLGGARGVLPFLLAVALQLLADVNQNLAIEWGWGWIELSAAVYLVVPLLLAWAAHRCPPDWTVAETPWRPRLAVRDLVLPVVGVSAALLVLTASSLTTVGALPVLLAVVAVVASVVRSGLTMRATESFYELRAQALVDPVTGVGNRRALDAALTGLLRGRGRSTAPTALLLLDLDSFHDVNDALGHLVGDEVLGLQAARLGSLAPAGSVVVRVAGDTFAVVLPGTGEDDARRQAARLAERLGQPLQVQGTRVRLSASVGVAVAPPVDDDRCPITLLRRAHDALARAKGSAEVVVVDRGDRGAGVEVSRLQLAEELRTAITEGQLVLFLQPQVHLVRGVDGVRVTSVAGCEALARWAHPTRGLLGAAQVLAAAEHGRLLPALSDAVLRLALASAATWWPTTPVPVSVNLSATDLDDHRLPDRVHALLHEHGLPPWALTVEVVEDTLLVDSGRSNDVLHRLRELGVVIAIDDYGTGYSSLAYLHELPVDELKLDRSLTADLATNRDAAAIVRHSIALAHDLGVRVVGEGVEEPAALAALGALGCDVVQGYLTGAPMPHADWISWLADHTAAPAR